MSANALIPVLICAGERSFVRAFAFVFSLAALAAAASPPWAQQQELTAAPVFGVSVSVSGDTALIGAAGNNGAAYVFVRSGDAWSQQQTLTGAGGTAYDNFGVSASVDGDTAAVGASGSAVTQGAAYVFVRGGGVWSQQQKLTASDGEAGDAFGSALSVSGDTAVIGAPGKNGSRGAAYVFVRSGTTWTQQQELTASDGTAGDAFGSALSVSGDTVVIGAPGWTGSLGVTYVFVRSGTTWTQQQELTVPDSTAYSSFGSSVSVSGDAAVIGESGTAFTQGAAYVFVRSGGVWGQQQRLTASDGAAEDLFGWSVSMSGDMAVIGAWAETVGSSPRQGAAYVFLRSNGVWSQQQELIASDGLAYAGFGSAVSLSGDTALIGDEGKAGFQGAAYVFATTQPTITGVIVSGGGTSIAQNTWVEIYGSNLAPASVGTGLTWGGAPSFASGQMPTQLQGVSVTVNGNPAYVYFVSPTQVNVLTPLDSTTGPVAVIVNNGSTASAAFTANLQAAAPGFLRLGDGVHIAAEHADYSLLGPASMSVPGYTFTPARPGETILLFGDGFGLPVSMLTAGSDVQTGALPTWPQVTIGGATATVQYAGLISPGLYQINVVVPLAAATGDNQVIATYAAASSPAGAMIPVSQ